MPFATAIISGSILYHSWAKSLPVLPKPHWTSSIIRRVPVLSHKSFINFRVCSGNTLIPPSPWIGSTITAAVLLFIFSYKALLSLKLITLKPGIKGPKPSLILFEFEVVIAAIDLPWKHPSKDNISYRFCFNFEK